MADSPLMELGRALDATQRLIADIKPEQWQLPTPCTDWSVREVANHLVGGNRMFATIVRGGGATQGGGAAADHLGEDPVQSYRDAADDLLDAFSRPGAMEQVVTVPMGTVPGIVALHLRVVEVFVHGWDVARGTGQSVSFDDAAVERELAFTRATLPDVPSNRTPFAPPQPVADDAPAIDRLAACLGRSVGDGGRPPAGSSDESG